MPTHEEMQSFWDDWGALTPEQRRTFQVARRKLVEDLKTGAGTSFRAGLRVKRVQQGKTDRVYEMTWAPDGRATFQFGSEQKPGEPHIIWRRIGGHEILDRP